MGPSMTMDRLRRMWPSMTKDTVWEVCATKDRLRRMWLHND